MTHQPKFLRQSASILLYGIVLALMSTQALAQTTAQISGRVADESGAVIPGAEITATQTDTQISRNSVSNETGSYVLPSLQIGPYRLEVTLPGFQTYVETGIVLSVNEIRTIFVTLVVGQTSQTVEVVADALVVETRTTSISSLMSNENMLALPLNGRRLDDLILLAPTAVQGGRSAGMGSRGYTQTVVSLGGGMAAGTTYKLDGATYNDPYSGLSITMPFPDALEEFKMETSAMPAEVGHHSAGSVTAVTKAGTNEIHGSLFNFLRHDAMNAQRALVSTKEKLKRNQFGGTIGGPIIRDKLFFFGALQITRQNEDVGSAFEYAPTDDMVAGDFRDFMSPACNAGRTIAPLRGAFADPSITTTPNFIDPATFATLRSPAALNLVNHENFPRGQDECGKVSFVRKQDFNNTFGVAKVDLEVSENHSMFFRYLDMSEERPTDWTDPGNIIQLSRGNVNSRIRTGALGVTSLLSPNVVNSFSSYVNRIRNDAVPPDHFDLSELGVNDVTGAVAGYLNISVTNGNGFTLGGGSSIRTTYNSTQWGVDDDLSWLVGNHQVKIGVSYNRLHTNNRLGLSRNPRPFFNGQFTGRGLADLMLGQMSRFVQGSTGQDTKRFHYFATYIQTTWQATPDLTVNMGLRWEPYISPSHKEDFVVAFDEPSFMAGTRSTVFPNAPPGLVFPGDALQPDSKFSDNRWGNFAPRLGLAWNPGGDRRMTIRAAAGIFFETPYAFKQGPTPQSPPFTGNLTLNVPLVGSFDDPWANFGGNPFPVDLANPRFPLGGNYPNMPFEMATPYVTQWNLSLQRQLGSDWLISANYMGTATRHLWSSTDGNPVQFLTADPDGSCMINGTRHNPCNSRSNYAARRKFTLIDPVNGPFLNAMGFMDDGATASYNAALFTIQRRSDRMNIQANYTWAHCIGTQEEVWLGIGSRFPNPTQGREYWTGDCNQDRRHNFRGTTVLRVPEFSNSVVQGILGDWSLSGIVRLQTGSGLQSLSTGVDTSLVFADDGNRPNQILDDPYDHSDDKFQWLNTAAFERPATGEWGNTGYFAFDGPGTFTVDVGLTRSFQVTEGQSFEFRMEAFNFLNHVNPNNPSTSLRSSNFGRSTSVKDPRIIQIAFKYLF